MEDNFMRYGDLVTLTSQEFEGGLSSFGFLDSGCYLQQFSDSDLRHVLNSRAMVFQILPKLNYENSQELRKSNKLHLAKDPALLEVLEHLRQKADTERDLNSRTVEQRTGSLVYYGQEIQLRHAASDMFLSGSKETAEGDRSCYTVMLSDHISSGAHFKLHSRYKLRQEGDAAMYHDVVMLTCSKLELYLHVSDKPIFAEKPALPTLANKALCPDMAPTASAFANRFEVNISSQKSTFQFEPFAQSGDSGYLHGGIVIRLVHTELAGLVCSEGVDFTKDGLADVYVRKYKGEDPEEDTSAHTVFILEQNASKLVGKTCTWMESQQPVEYRLRHFTTRRVVCVTKDQEGEILSLARHPHEAEQSGDNFQDTLFYMIPTAVEQNNMMRDGCIVKIKSKSRSGYVSTTTEEWALLDRDQPALLHQESNRHDSDFFMPLEIDELAVRRKKIVLLPSSALEDAYQLTAVSIVETHEIEFVMSAVAPLRQFSSMFEMGTEPTRGMYQKLENVLGRLILFCNVSQDRDPYTCEGAPVPRRQKFLRELGVIDLVCHLLHFPFVGGSRQLGSLGKEEPLTKVCTLGYRLVRLAAKDNRANELYCAQWMGLFLSHAEMTTQNNSLHPEETLTEILSDNRRLLERHIHSKMVEKFVNLIERCRDEKYGKLVTVLCTCDGEAITRNQNTICDLLGSNSALLERLMMRLRMTGKSIEVEMAEASAWVRLDQLEKIAQEGEAGNLYDYFLALLDLISNLALSRNHQTDALRTYYSLDMCFACAKSASLNSLMRSKFVHMLLYLHIDQGDVQPLSLPNFTHIWSELQLDFPCSKATLPPAIILAKDFVSEFLQFLESSSSDPHHNELVKEVLHLTHFLVSCGVYTSEVELQNLIPSLVHLLEFESQDAAVLECKRVVCSILSLVTTIQLDYQLTLLLTRLKSNRFLWGEDVTPLASKRMDSDEEDIEQYSRVSALASKQAFHPFDDIADTDPQSAAVNIIEQIAAEKFLDISESAGANLYQILLNLMLSTDSSVVRGSFELLLKHFTKRHQLATCLQQVQLLEGEKAVKVYRKITKRVADLSLAAENAEMWLGRDVEASSFISSFGNDMQVSQTHTRVNEILQYFIGICSKQRCEKIPTLSSKTHGTRRVSVTEVSALFIAAQDLQEPVNILEDSEDQLAMRLLGPTEVSDKDNQRLLRNLKVYQPVLEIAAHKGIIVGYNEQRHRAVLRHCYLFLAKFCHRNPQNQELIYAHLERCLEDLNKNVCAGLLVQEVFLNNAALCSRVPAKYIRMIVKQIDNTPLSLAKCSLFRVLGVLVKSNDRVFKANQLEVVSQLASPDLGNILLLYNTNEDFCRLQESIKSCVGLYGGQPPVVKEREIHVPMEAAYLIQLFDVLSMCAEDWNSQAELICQRVLSLQQLDRLLEVTEQFWPFRNVLILYFLHVYLDIEFALHDNEKMLWVLLERINVDLTYIFENYTKEGHAYTPEIENSYFILGDRRASVKDFAMHYVFRALVPTLTEVFMKRGAGLNIEARVDLIASLVTNVIRFHRLAVQPTHLETSKKLLLVFLDIDKFRKFASGVDVASHKVEHRSSQITITTNVLENGKTWQLTKVARNVIESPTFVSYLDKEFRSVVLLMRDVDKTSSVTPRQLFASFIALLQAQITSEQFETSLAGLKILRLSIESHNPDLATPAAEWDTSDWIRFQVPISMSQDMLAHLGAVSLALALFTTSKSKEIRGECLLLMIAMLLGGNPVVQQEFLKQLQADSSNRFLLTVRSAIMTHFDVMRRQTHTQIQDAERQLRERNKPLNDSQSTDMSANEEFELWIQENLDVQVRFVRQNHLLPTEMARNSLRFLQLLCEGHNLATQNYLREQRVAGTLNSRSTNLVAAIGTLLGPYTKVLHRENIEVGFQLLDTLTEMVQGPCRGTQAELSQPKIIDNCRDMLICLRYLPDRKIRGLDGDEGKELISELKSKTANFLLSLLEGEYDQEITDRISASLDFRRIKERMADVFASFIDELGLSHETATLRKINEAMRRDSFEGHIDEGFNLFILMNKLAENNEQARRQLPNKGSTRLELLAFTFFKGHTGRIEVLVEKNLQRVYFPILPICRFISEASKKELLDWVERDSHASKIFGLLKRSTALIDEMEHNEVLSRSRISPDMEKFSLLRNLCSILAFFINLMILFFYDFTQDEPRHLGSPTSTVIRVCGIFLVIFSGFSLILWLLLQGSVHVKGKWRERVAVTARNMPAPAIVSPHSMKSLPVNATLKILLARGPDAIEFNTEGKRNFIHFLTAVVYYLFCARMLHSAQTFQILVVYTLFAGLGQYDYFFYSFLLFDIVFRSPTLMGIVNAIINNNRQLLMTLMLAASVIFIYAFWGFYISPWMYWQSGFNTAGWGESLCQSLWQCFLTSLDNGPRLSGGIGDLLIKFPFDDKHRWYSRFFMDSSYFFAIRLMFLSIITGIIIDSFAQMRERKKFTEDDKKTKCFICNIDRAVLDRLGNGYEKHCAEDHNVWHYVYFLIHLKNKDPTELTGVESYCAYKLRMNDIGWVPVLQAMCLKDDSKTREREDLQVEEACKRLQALILQVRELRKKINS